MIRVRLKCLFVSMLLVAILMNTPAFALQLSGYVNSDTGMVSPKAGITQPYIDFQVRYNLKEKKTLDNGMFIEVFSQLMATTTTLTTDVTTVTEVKTAPTTTARIRECWAKVGFDNFEVKFGRFEKIVLFERGEDIMVPNVESETENVRYRALLDAVFGRSTFDYSLTYNFNPEITFELGGTWYPTKFTGISDKEANDWGLRPVFQYKTNSILAKFGYEFKRREAQDNQYKTQRDTDGVGGTLQYTFSNKLILGTAVGHRTDLSDDDFGVRIGEVFTTSGGVYTRIPVFKNDLFNLAGYYTDWKFNKINLYQVKRVSVTHVYGSYDHAMAIKGARVALALGYTKTGWDEGERGLGAAVRFTFAF